MSYYMGIDGGGSTLRVALIHRDSLQPSVEIQRGTANPNLIGRETAAQQIQAAMRDSLSQAGITAEQVQGVGIGIAGASAAYASDWLHALVRAVLPTSHLVAASDNEIALVGALGKRQGLLLLSGTGSGAFGINASGNHLQVGGWGYLLGDEGSGYWLGVQALKVVIQAFDHDQTSALSQAISQHLGLHSARQLIETIYLGTQPIPTIAQLAPFILKQAAAGDPQARVICVQAADALYQQAILTIQRLDLHAPDIAFAGSILSHDNVISQDLCRRFDLAERPQARYRPVIGAALLAQLCHSTQ